VSSSLPSCRTSSRRSFISSSSKGSEDLDNWLEERWNAWMQALVTHLLTVRGPGSLPTSEEAGPTGRPFDLLLTQSPKLFLKETTCVTTCFWPPHGAHQGPWDLSQQVQHPTVSHNYPTCNLPCQCQALQ
jgi:hypothetical protein